jgi:hypothetical protein
LHHAFREFILQAFLKAFQVHFSRPEGGQALEHYTTGLLTELPNKPCDTMAQALPGTSTQRLQEFLTDMQGDEEELNRQRVQKIMAGRESRNASCSHACSKATEVGALRYPDPTAGQARDTSIKNDLKASRTAAVVPHVHAWW